MTIVYLQQTEGTDKFVVVFCIVLRFIDLHLFLLAINYTRERLKSVQFTHQQKHFFYFKNTLKFTLKYT